MNSNVHRFVILCICWDTQTVKTILWQLPIVYTVFKSFLETPAEHARTYMYKYVSLRIIIMSLSMKHCAASTPAMALQPSLGLSLYYYKNLLLLLLLLLRSRPYVVSSFSFFSELRSLPNNPKNICIARQFPKKQTLPGK